MTKADVQYNTRTRALYVTILNLLHIRLIAKRRIGCDRFLCFVKHKVSCTGPWCAEAIVDYAVFISVAISTPFYIFSLLLSLIMLLLRFYVIGHFTRFLYHIIFHAHLYCHFFSHICLTHWVFYMNLPF